MDHRSELTLTRRQFSLKSLAAIATTSLIPNFAYAHGGRDHSHSHGHEISLSPSTFSAQIGDYTITAILDGIAPLKRELFSGPNEQIDAVLKSVGLSTPVLPSPVNSFLLRSKDRNILIDAGVGENKMLGSGLGRLTAGLETLEVKPSEIDTIIITHCHPDHIGGLIQDGKPVFPKAEVILAEKEAKFWTSSKAMKKSPEKLQGLFKLNQGILKSYGDQITQVRSGKEIAPGMILEVLPGHTPGHSLIHIDGGSQQLILIADTLHNAELHTAVPKAKFAFDIDPEQAAKSRIQLFDKLASDKILIAGSHLHFPGFGRILSHGDAYRYSPASLI